MKNTVTWLFIPWFSSPPRLAYVHVVEVSTKGLSSPPRLAFASFSSQENELFK
jgi:hypothetical protein